MYPEVLFSVLQVVHKFFTLYLSVFLRSPSLQIPYGFWLLPSLQEGLPPNKIVSIFFSNIFEVFKKLFYYISLIFNSKTATYLLQYILHWKSRQRNMLWLVLERKSKFPIGWHQGYYFLITYISNKVPVLSSVPFGTCSFPSFCFTILSMFARVLISVTRCQASDPPLLTSKAERKEMQMGKGTSSHMEEYISQNTSQHIHYIYLAEKSYSHFPRPVLGRSS